MGIFELTAQDLLNAANGMLIAHALGMGCDLDLTVCAVKLDLWRVSDFSLQVGCKLRRNCEPNLMYGVFRLVLKPSVNVANLGGSVDR